MNLVNGVIHGRPVLRVAFVSLVISYFIIASAARDINPLNWAAYNDMLYFVLTITIMTRGFCMIYIEEKE